MKNELAHIGTVELVSFSENGIQNVPAKIDTGADNSAIWASNIHLSEGKLTFNFFAPGSTYYRDEVVETTAFKTAKIKNSFGQQEFRYKIRLKTSIGGRKITTWFSLANRAQSNYPVLLGKSFLQTRFVVDVSRKYIISEKSEDQSVLVIAAPENKSFFKKVSSLSSIGVSYDCANYDSLIFYINGSDTKVLNLDNECRDLADYSLVYFKARRAKIEFAASVANYLRFKGCYFIDREMDHTVSESKLSEYMKLSCFNIPIPSRICATTKVLVDKYDDIKEHIGSPFVLKEITSDRGKNNFLIADKKTFLKILNDSPIEYVYIAQKYIDNDGYLRLYVTGDEVALAVKRSVYNQSNPLKSHLNKPAGGVNARKVPLTKVPKTVQELAVNAAQFMDRQIAGVDLMQDKLTGVWYILEVNNGPQLYSGSYIDEKAESIAKFFDKELR
jgi:glutathione synthase/RimK-type ligase-like ATP-grasp enzyme